MGLFVALVGNTINKLRTEPPAYRQLESDEYRQLVDLQIAVSHHNCPLSQEQLYKERDANSDEALHMSPEALDKKLMHYKELAKSYEINPDNPISFLAKKSNHPGQSRA